MQDFTPEGLRILEDVARRHSVSLDAVVALLRALVEGNGSQAQFNHPDLGGMGQWSQGGMIMVGDMFNQGLKHRVDTLCNELSGVLRDQQVSRPNPGSFQSQGQNGGGGISLFAPGARSASSQWWPEDLGFAASVGAQNDLRYACFPAARRLAIQQGGRISVHDTGEHAIMGFAQQQGGDQSLTFTSQFGVVRVADLPLVTPFRDEPERNAAPSMSLPTREPPGLAASTATAASPAAAPAKTVAMDDIFTMIERLGELRQKDILTEEEFAAKKSDLLSRL